MKKRMKWWAIIFTLLWVSQSRAWVVSPTSEEVQFSYTAEFQTQSHDPAADLMERHAEYLFGYMQNPEIARAWNIKHGTFGIGAPRWVPQFHVLSDYRSHGVRTLRYQAEGRLLLLNTVAESLLSDGHWDVTLPYDLDHFYDAKCTDEGGPSESWYFYDPFRKGCEELRSTPLAQAVRVQIAAVPGQPADLPANLDDLRDGDGDGLFLITTINGFDNASTTRGDPGRENYEKMNTWFRSQGFTDTFTQRYKNRPIHQFDKTIRQANGRPLHIRVVRLLAQTDLEGSRDVTFAKFFEKAVTTADVIVYEGHSGSSVDQSIGLLEKRALGRLRFNRNKRQLFLLDACSSYSYYLDMLEGKKAPGTLNVLTDGLESVFDYEIPVTKRFYKILFDVHHQYTWDEMIQNMETPMRGFTSMLNAEVL